MSIFTQKKRIPEVVFNFEKDFEKEIFDNYKLLFGNQTILIDAKRKISSKEIGATIPDGFLFDLSDKNEPKFYLIEVELKKHSFWNHIVPQITKFFGFYKNQEQRLELPKKLYEIITSDDKLKSDFTKLIGDQEIFKFLVDVIDSNQNILIIIDGFKTEFSEIFEIHEDTWGEMVKVITMKKYSDDVETIYQLEPELKVLDIMSDENIITNTKGESNFLRRCPEIAKEWHPTKNGDKKPEHFTYGSNEIIWWLCPINQHPPHPAKIKEKTRNNPTGCPYCTGNKVDKDTNSLLHLFPEIAKEWHPTMNGDKKPEHFTHGSNEIIWWLCPKQHAYDLPIKERTSNKPSGCRTCYKEKRKVSSN
jgi:hypothetical protein